MRFPLLLVSIAILMLAVAAYARDPGGKYAQANPELHKWFEDQRSGRGPCCSDADGTALQDTDWEGTGDIDFPFRVQIEGKWWKLPKEAVLPGPNKAGKTIVWPIYYRTTGPEGSSQSALDRIDIRCFIPGNMS
jgi:hypothetical protein